VIPRRTRIDWSSTVPLMWLMCSRIILGWPKPRIRTEREFSNKDFPEHLVGLIQRSLRSVSGVDAGYARIYADYNLCIDRFGARETRVWELFYDTLIRLRFFSLMIDIF
jgi:hypothetical protein